MTPHVTVTEYFGLSQNVPFANVNAHTDTRLFVDPRAIRLEKTPAPFTAHANECTKSFFDEVARCITSPSQTENLRALELLQKFNEPRQTRMGLAKSGINGHGGSAKVGRWIWETLSTDAYALLRIAILKWIEDVPLFVEGVGTDITSDLTTRIIFSPLAEFTSTMVAAYPEFTSGKNKLVNANHQVWNPVALEWEQKNFLLPSIDGVALLLVPQNWARPNLLMTATRYYETGMLSYIQRKDAPRDQKGNLILTPKDRIRESGEYPRGRETITRVTTKAVSKGDNPLAEFRRFVDERYEPTH